MKTLIFTRHAKSSWEKPGENDFDRPLNNRGFEDAPFMAAIVKEFMSVPDIIYSSPANRAITTASIFSEVLDYGKNNIIPDIKIYEQGSKYIINLITGLNNDLNSVMLFGHNPDITSLATFYSGEFFDNIPTCGIICLDFKVDTWTDTKQINGKIRFYEYPKKHKHS